MKATFILSALFTPYALANQLDTVKLVQSCESVRNARKVVEQTQTGQKYVKKDAHSHSSETTEYTQVHCVVTAFMQRYEAEVGEMDKLAAKVKKMGGSPLAIETIPATIHNQDVGVWLAKHKVVTDADKEAQAAKDKAEAKAAIEATEKQVANAKSKGKAVAA